MKARPILKFLWQLPAKLTNKYVIALLFFAVWMIFFDEHNLINQYERNQQIKKLEEERQFYSEQIKLLKEERDLIRNQEEKYAREKYFMHRADEEVYVIRN